VKRVGVLAIACLLAACGGSSDGPVLPQSSPAPTSPVSTNACVTFSPGRAEPSSDAQRVSVQVVARMPSCEWQATTGDDWIRIVRTGPLVTTGSGVIAFDVVTNKDEGFGGCVTTARTGWITVTDQRGATSATLQVVQQGSPGPFHVPAACIAAPIGYGAPVSGSWGSGDCIVGTTRAKHYTFQGFSGQEIVAALTSSPIGGPLQMSAITLYGPGGGYVTATGSIRSNPELTRRLSCGGTFTLEVRSVIDSDLNPTGFGTFTLRLTSRN
jgi:hypothetical protein